MAPSAYYHVNLLRNRNFGPTNPADPAPSLSSLFNRPIVALENIEMCLMRCVHGTAISLRDVAAVVNRPLACGIVAERSATPCV